MKTTQNTLSEGTLKALALMQHNNEPFFIVHPDTADSAAYMGTLEDAISQHNEYVIGQNKEGDIILSIYEWCAENYTAVSEYNEDDNNYLVLTDEEADEKAAEYIKDSLWAFNPSFLADMTGLSSEIFKAIQENDKCEGTNDTIYNTVHKLCGIDVFVEAAISADGRGRFMSSYDGNEKEETVEGATFYIYRMK